MIGLGRMGANMTQRLLSGGHRIVVYDQNADAVVVQRVRRRGGRSIRPRLGGPPGLAPRGLGNAAGRRRHRPRHCRTGRPAGRRRRRDRRRQRQLQGHHATEATLLAEHGIHLLDAGTSGGVWGLVEGYSLMVGGDPDTFARLEPIFQTLAPAEDKGYSHVGPTGAGHFTKMVHNGVEYALMQAYAEGFELLQAKQADFDLDLKAIAKTWQHGSVVRSWLLDLAVLALEADPGLESLSAYVDDSGEGRWTVNESVALAVPTPAITAALYQRFRSRQEEPFGARMLAALRNQFGGHAVRESGRESNPQ